MMEYYRNKRWCGACHKRHNLVLPHPFEYLVGIKIVDAGNSGYRRAWSERFFDDCLLLLGRKGTALRLCRIRFGR